MTRLAYLGAINAYPSPYQLQGQINSLNDLHTTLIGKGFSVTTQTDAAATKANILANLSALVSQTQNGDSAVFGLFGHGSYILGGNEPDGRIECFCAYDVFQGGLITDDEFAAILANVRPGVASFEVVLGCCYSGTGTRAVAAKSGEIEQYKKALCIPGPLKAPVAKAAKASVPVAGMTHVLWAACRADQTAWEVLTTNGIFNLHELYLGYAWRNYANYTRNAVNNWITARVMAFMPSQEPQIEGTSAELAQAPFT